MDWQERLDREISREMPELKMLAEEPMARHTSFRIGGPARRMAFPGTVEQFVRLMEIAGQCGIVPFVMGNGTNLLIPDEGLDRLVVHTGELRRIAPGQESGTFTAEAGCLLRQAAEYACTAHLTGLEFAHGIPGSVGGAVCMNAGAYGGEMSQVLLGVTALFPSEGVRYVEGKDLDLGYRHSLFTENPEAAVLSARFRLEPGEEPQIRQRMRELMDRRRASQPLEFPSAGSTFKRPQGYYAGTLIDQCGLKGLRIGGAEVSQKHAGFLINRGSAACADVLALIQEVQKRVKDQTGVELEPEVRIIR